MHGKTKLETTTVNELVCGFEVFSRVLNFIVMGHYTTLQSNRESQEHQRYLWSIVLQEKSQSAMRKLNHKQEHYLVCGCVDSLHVLFFAVIGHNRYNKCS